MIDIPDHLGIDAPDDMPIIELAQRLQELGYELTNSGHGDLVAVPNNQPVPEYIDRPEWDDVCPGCFQRRRSCICGNYWE